MNPLAFSELKVRFIGGNSWELLAPLVYHHKDGRITVPKGFKTDFASIPRPFWAILSPTGKYAPAAIIHDWMYANRIGTRRRADQLFLHGMCDLGVSWVARNTIYSAVRVFGHGVWKD